jgi:hypothetical protein
VSQLSPELARGLLRVARALLVATRNWTLYSPEHPAVGCSVERLTEAIRDASRGGAFGVGITPDTLLIDGVAPTQAEAPVSEAAALLHDRDLLHMTLMGLFPVGTLVRLNTEEIAVVTAEHPTDPFRLQVKIVTDKSGALAEDPMLANTWDRDDKGEQPYAVVEAVDPESTDIDPLTYL